MGAPYLIFPKPAELVLDLHISISHTGPWVAFALSPRKTPLTIDIEDIQKPRSFTKITNSVFSKQEQAYVQQYGALGFYYLWGSKEALAKWYKQGLSFALSVDLSDQLCPPHQNSEVSIDYGHQRFLLTFLVDGAILTTTCREDGK